MLNRKSILIGLIVVGLALTSSLAVYYKQQAVHYQQEWSVAAKELNRLAAVPTQVPDAPAEARTPTVRWKPAAAPIAPRQELEPQVVEMAQPAPVPGAPRMRSADTNRFGRRGEDWMENLRTNDPERYAEFQQRRQERQSSIQSAWMQATNYFLSRDTSKMSQADAEEYSTMISLLGQAWSLNQQLQSSLPPEARQQVMSDLRSNVVAVVPLLDNERNREYYDLAVAMGHSDADAATLVNAVNQITSNTSLRTILPGVRTGGGPGGGFGGGFGAGPGRGTGGAPAVPATPTR